MHNKKPRDFPTLGELSQYEVHQNPQQPISYEELLDTKTAEVLDSILKAGVSDLRSVVDEVMKDALLREDDEREWEKSQEKKPAKKKAAPKRKAPVKKKKATKKKKRSR